jgi:hypothetical protein
MVRKSEVATVVSIALLALIGCGQATTTTKAPGAPATVTATATHVATATAPTPAAQPTAAAPAAAHEEPGDVGTVAPPFKGKTWITADSKAPDLKNKVCVVEFWQIT